MNRFDAWAVHVSTLLVGGTGLIYAWMRYLAEPADPYAIVNHPWQSTVQHLHLWLAPLLVFTVGVIWRRHVWENWRRGRPSGRSSGLLLLFALAPMVVSGYLIQTAVTDLWRNVWVVVHLVSSGVWVAGHAAHGVVQFRRRRREELVSEPPEGGEARAASGHA